jgi:sulfur carrier protein ThiS adenylyltransferase
MNLEKSEKIRKKLKNSAVGIAGVGGLGSNAAVSLARAGIGRLVLVDYDRVDESNLTRQYFFRDQVGKVKVEALKDNILRINPWIKVEIFNQRLVKGSMDDPFHDVDVVVEALDKAETKAAFIEEIMLKLPDKPLVACSGVAGYGHIERIEVKHIGNLHMVQDEQARSSDDDILLAPRVCLMANWEANLVLDILLGEDK